MSLPSAIFAYLNQPPPELVGRAASDLFDLIRGQDDKAKAQPAAADQAGAPVVQEPPVEKKETPAPAVALAVDSNRALALHLTTPQDSVRQAELQQVTKPDTSRDEEIAKKAAEDELKLPEPSRNEEIAKPDTSRDEEIARKLAEEELKQAPAESFRDSVKTEAKASRKEEKEAQKELKRLKKEERRASGHHHHHKSHSHHQEGSKKRNKV